MTPPLVYGTPVPFIRFLKIDENMRPDIKRRRVQLTTARFLLGSVPSQLFLSFVDAVGAVASSRFRVFASLATPSAHVRRPFRRSAWCCAPSLPASRATGYSLCCAAPRSFGYVSEGVRASGTRRPHQPLWGSLYGSAISSRHTPMFRQIRKKGGVAASLRGVNSYSSKPCTTVSNVLESNAFAASVTGR